MAPYFLTAPAAEASPVATLIGSVLPFVLVLIVFYFLLIRPQKKRENEIAKMRSVLDIGDEVITSGGIVGTIVSMREDTVVIETGSDRSKIRIARWAISQNNTIHG